MKVLKQTITINKPAQEIFDFCINPENTPKWIDAIVQEQTNEWPVKLGTIYHNQRKDGNWSEYEVTTFEPGKLFAIRQKKESFNVKYTFKPVGDNAVELEFAVWKDEGELNSSLTAEVLEGMLGKLKYVMETS